MRKPFSLHQGIKKPNRIESNRIHSAARRDSVDTLGKMMKIGGHCDRD